jgi:hypothetical protein
LNLRGSKTRFRLENGVIPGMNQRLETPQAPSPSMTRPTTPAHAVPVQARAPGAAHRTISQRPGTPITPIEFSARTGSGTRVRLPLRAGYVVRADWWPVLAIRPAALSVFLAAHAAEPCHISQGLPCKGARRARPRCRRVLGSRPRSEPFLRSTRRSLLRDRSYPAERRR